MTFDGSTYDPDVDEVRLTSHFAGDDSPSARRVIAAAQAVIDGDRAIRTAIAEREAGLS